MFFLLMLYCLFRFPKTNWSDRLAVARGTVNPQITGSSPTDAAETIFIFHIAQKELFSSETRQTHCCLQTLCWLHLES